LQRGGDKRRIIRPEGRELSQASLLMQALCEDTSEAGIKFNQEREQLFRRWRCLVAKLQNHSVSSRGPGPPAALDRYVEWLNLALRHSKWPEVGCYLGQVGEFCDQWRLDAWWTVPAMIQSHFFRIKTDLDTPPLSLYSVGAWPGASNTIVVKLPGASDDQFERDRCLFSGLMASEVQQVNGEHVVARWRPNRAEMTRAEVVSDAACVVVDWDGRNRYRSRYDPAVEVKTSIHVVEECEARLHRRVTKREQRAIVKQITPQLMQARRRLLDSGFHVEGKADLHQHAGWIAQRLLDPSLSWASITGADAAQLPSVIRSGHRFANNAKLTLASRRLPPASRKLK